MEKITFKGTPVHTYGKLPKVGSQAPCFTLTRSDLTELYCHDLKGRRIVLNIFPSLDTSVCATSVRKFNELAASLDNTTVVAVSKDLPFAQSRFCTTEDIKKLNCRIGIPFARIFKRLRCGNGRRPVSRTIGPCSRGH